MDGLILIGLIIAILAAVSPILAIIAIVFAQRVKYQLFQQNQRILSLEQTLKRYQDREINQQTELSPPETIVASEKPQQYQSASEELSHYSNELEPLPTAPPVLNSQVTEEVPQQQFQPTVDVNRVVQPLNNVGHPSNNKVSGQNNEVVPLFSHFF
ncbi:hypothetical protein PY546_04790 [Providencia stuartii]|nr:hypothetical protein [Providencia stuartii]